ncbi:MAG: hypothetical protein ABJL67_06030 [Sulfitobacter sp.]
MSAGTTRVCDDAPPAVPFDKTAVLGPALRRALLRGGALERASWFLHCFVLFDRGIARQDTHCPEPFAEM